MNENQMLHYFPLKRSKQRSVVKEMREKETAIMKYLSLKYTKET